jgi:hypothetical protein
VSEHPQLLECRGCVGFDLLDLPHERFVRETAPKTLKLDLEQKEALLRAVVQIALEAVALLICACDDPRPRGAELIDESRILEQHQRRLCKTVHDIGGFL